MFLISLHSDISSQNAQSEFPGERCEAVRGKSSHAGRHGCDDAEGHGDVHEGVGALLREPRATTPPQRHQPRVQSHAPRKLRRTTNACKFRDELTSTRFDVLVQQ